MNSPFVIFMVSFLKAYFITLGVFAHVAFIAYIANSGALS